MPEQQGTNSQTKLQNPKKRIETYGPNFDIGKLHLAVSYLILYVPFFNLAQTDCSTVYLGVKMCPFDLMWPKINRPVLTERHCCRSSFWSSLLCTSMITVFQYSTFQWLLAGQLWLLWHIKQFRIRVCKFSLHSKGNPLLKSCRLGTQRHQLP